MSDSLQCKHCGKPVRAHAKFCPHCGEKTGADGGSGILSFDDFFEEETKDPQSPAEVSDAEEAPRETGAADETGDESEPEPKAEAGEDADAREPRSRALFTFRDRERKRKVKMLDDTLELPIEEIQREIARRRERERMELRTPEEKHAEKQKMTDEFDKLKQRHGDPEVLIPESEILEEGDRQEKKSIFSRARDYLLGVDVDDIEGVDIKKEEELEEQKAKRALFERSRAGRAEVIEPEEISEPVAVTRIPKASEDETPEVVPGPAVAEVTAADAPEEGPAAAPEQESVPVLSVPKKDAETGRDTGEEIKKTTWFGTLFDRRRDTDEEEMVVPLAAADREEAAPEEDRDAPVAASFGRESETADALPADEKRRRRNIILGVAAALILMAGVGLFFTGNYMSDPLRLTESFAEAVETEDMDAVASMLNANGTPVTAQTLGPFREMLQNPDYKNSLLSSLQTFNEENGRSEEADVWIEETGSRYLFFNAYQMHIKTFEVNPSVSYPNTLVSVDGGEPVAVSPDAPAALGPFLPGTHQLSSVYEGGLNPLHSAATVELTTGNENLEEDRLAVDLSNPGSFATLTSPQEEAVVLLDGREIGKVKDLGEEGLRFGPFEDPVSVQLRLDTPIGQVESDVQQADANGAALDFAFTDLVEISDYHDEATVILNGESTGAKAADFIPFGRMIGPVKPDDTLQMEMEIDGRLTKSNVVTVGESEMLRFSYWKSFEFPWRYSDATVFLDGEDTGQTVYQLAGDDMTADLLNSYETIKISKRYPWGTFESNTVSLDTPGSLSFTINPINSTLYRQLQDAVVRHLEEDAFAISNLKPDNYSNIEDPLLSERRAFIQELIDEQKRIVRVSDTAIFDMNSIQFDDEDTYYARITETYVYNYQEYEAGIFRPIRLQMQEAQEVMQHAMRYDKSAGKWMIYDNRPRESMGQSNTEAIDLAY